MVIKESKCIFNHSVHRIWVLIGRT